MSINEVKDALNAGQYKAPYVEVPPAVVKGHVFDEEKSVKWNREQEEKARQARQEAITANRQAELAAVHNFATDLINAIQEDYDLSAKQANRLYSEAWEHGHSYGFHEVLSWAETLGSFVQDILSQ